MPDVQHPPLDDAEAVSRALAGETAAFGALVERYQEVAFRTAYLTLRDAAAAEDAAQEAFIRAYGKLRTFRQGEPFRPWLLRIVTNVALNHVRAEKRRAGATERAATLVAASAPSPAGEAESAEAAETLLRAIGELPEDDRIVLHLRYFIELPEREIAAAIGKPAGTVKSRLHRASKRLRDVIEARYPGLKEAFDG